MLAAALDYAEKGLKIIPLNGKSPRIKGGKSYLDASSDPVKIMEWWTEYPDANIGLAMGTNGLLALDIDPRNDGDDTLASLLEAHGPLPETPKQLTGGGGEHYVFRKCGKSSRSPGAGIDIVDAGYIVVAPSLHPETKVRYRWDKPFISIGACAELPDFLSSWQALTTRPPSLINLSQDPVFMALKRRGRLIEEPFIGRTNNETEKVNITCPWVNLHTDKKDDGAAYFAGGGFKCHHAHCEQRTIKDLLKWLGKQGEDVENLKCIQQQAIRDTETLMMSKAFNAPVEAEPIVNSDGDPNTSLISDKEPVNRYDLPGHPPGLVGDIAQFVQEQIAYKMPNIALATALSAVSRMISNQMVIVAPTGRKTSLNLFIVATAQSGAGKETCRTVLNEIGQSVANENLVASNPASPQALGRMLSEAPRTSLLLFQDEYGKKLAHANSGSGAYEAAVNAMLLELFPLALGTYAGRAYAKAKDDVKPAEQPYVCQLAVTTLEPWALALENMAIFDGTLNRFLYLPQPVKLIRNDHCSFKEIPEKIVEQCRKFWMGTDSPIQLVAALKMSEATNTIKQANQTYRIVQTTEEARKSFESFDRKLDKVKEAGGVRAALAARATELSIRVAGVVAVGAAKGPDECALEQSHAKYGLDLVQYSMNEMLTFVDEQLISTDTGRLPVSILEFCKDCIRNPRSINIPPDREKLRNHLIDGWVPRTLITLKFKNGVKKRDRDEAIATLVEAGDLEVKECEINGQSSHFYRSRGLQVDERR